MMRRPWVAAAVAGCLALLVLSLAARSLQTGFGPGAADVWAQPAVSRGGLVFVSAIYGSERPEHDGTSGIAWQTGDVLERMRSVLEAAGSSLGQLASVNVYLGSAADFAAMNEAYAAFFPEAPPTRTTVVSDLPEGALVAMSGVAVPNGARREVLHPSGWVKSPRPYSYIVRTEHLVFLSGLVSRRGVNDQLVPGTIGTQARTILDNARVLLRTAGLAFRDVVATKVFIADELYYVDMNDAYRRVFTSAPPARATAVTPLMTEEAKVEMTFIASTGGREVLGPTVAPSVPLSAAVAAGPFVFLSGVLGNTDANVSDPRAQMREALTRIGRTLETAGVTYSDVVENVVYVRESAQLAEVESVYREFFSSNPPARTTVAARLVPSTGLVEVMTVAVKGGH